MQLIESKSLLAKLMATENLIVEQRQVSTASFDVKNRILTVPILDKNISGHTYDLFMGHEVGHALYTPFDGLMKAKEEKINKGVVNVVEDCRIETKIRYKYPGLRNSFSRAYRELFEKNFFETEGIDLNEMNFLDRLNLYNKVGAQTGIRFSDVERVLVDEVESTQTFDDVLVVCRKIMELMKAEKEELKQKMKESGEDGSDGEEGQEYEDYDTDDWDDEESDDEEGQREDSEQNEGDEETEEVKNVSGQGKSDPSEDEIRSYTDEAYHRNEQKLFADNAREIVYCNIPKVDTKKVILPYKKLYNELKKEQFIMAEINDTDFMKTRTELNRVVSYLVKEFELRKNADQMKRASISKTGELNMSKIFSYQFSEDIFKKMSVVPNGKSHGLVLFLDWSGSMSNHILNTVKQLFSLVMFCKKVNIPFEVYAFNQGSFLENSHYKHNAVPTVGDIALYDFSLLNILSSKMTASEFKFAGSALLAIASRPRWYCPEFMQMSGTPLNETIITAMELVTEFKEQYKLQIVNTAFLSDGEGHILDRAYVDYGSHISATEVTNRYMTRKKNMMMRDPVTKNEVLIDDLFNEMEQTNGLIKLLKNRTGCNVIGFFILNGRELGSAMARFFPKTANYDQNKLKFRKEKNLVVTTTAFDEYYLIRSDGLSGDDEEFEVKENATTKGLVSAFTKYTGNRLANRVVLNRFIGLIS